jgi:hypothetical protein
MIQVLKRVAKESEAWLERGEAGSRAEPRVLREPKVCNHDPGPQAGWSEATKLFGLLLGQLYFGAFQLFLNASDVLLVNVRRY